MPRVNPQLGFLLRASILMIALLTLFWQLLMTPALAALRWAVSTPYALLPAHDSIAPITPGSDGQWDFHIPVDAVGKASTPGAPLLKLNNVDFSMSRPDIAYFTLAWPVYWALTLACAPRDRRLAWTLLKGSAMVAVLITLALIASAETTARLAISGLLIAPSPIEHWLLYVGQQIVLITAPSLAPIGVAFYLLPELSALFFSTPRPVEKPPDGATARRSTREVRRSSSNCRLD